MHFDGWTFYEAWGDIEKHYGADRTIVTFDPNFPCGPEGGQTVGYVAFRRVLYNMVKEHMYTWKSDISDEANESRLLSKIVNMKKKFKFVPANTTTSQAANQVKRDRQKADAEAVRAGNATAEQATRFGVTRALQRRTTDSVALSRALATEGQSVDIAWGANFADLKTSVVTYDA